MLIEVVDYTDVNNSYVANSYEENSVPIEAPLSSADFNLESTVTINK